MSTPMFARAALASLLLILGACASSGSTSPKPETPPLAPVVTPPPSTAMTPAPPAAQPAPADRPIPSDSVYPLLVAEFALRRNQYELALRHYLSQAYATRDPGVAETATRLARHLRADRETLDAALLWSEVDTRNLEPHLLSALLLTRDNQPRAALEQLQQVGRLGGNPEYSLIILGSMNAADDVRADLLLDINDMLAADPDNTELLLGRALLYQRNGMIEDALQDSQRVLTLEPSNVKAVNLEARLYLLMQQNDKAFRRFRQLLENNPEDQQLRLQYARLLTRTDLVEAQKQFEILAGQAPNNPDIIYSLALILFENRQFDTAEQRFDQLIEMEQHTHAAHYYLGRLSEQGGHLATARSHYEQVGASDELPLAIEGLVRIALRKDDLTYARQLIQDYRQRYPKLQTPLYLLEADLLQRLSRWQESKAVLDAALQAEPDNDKLRYARAMTHEQLGRIDLLEKDLRRILGKKPNHALALNALGYTLTNKTQRHDEALQLIRQALAITPEEPAVLDSMGWVLFHLGNLEGASDYLHQAYTKLPDPEIAAHYIEVLWQQHRRDDARSVLSSVLAKHPDNQPLKELMQRLGIRLEPQK